MKLLLIQEFLYIFWLSYRYCLSRKMSEKIRCTHTHVVPHKRTYLQLTAVISVISRGSEGHVKNPLTQNTALLFFFFTVLLPVSFSYTMTGFKHVRTDLACYVSLNVAATWQVRNPPRLWVATSRFASQIGSYIRLSALIRQKTSKNSTR